MQPGPELDTLVAQAMGIQVLGMAMCDGHEGWTVIGRADDPDFETARLQPCFLQECFCNDPDLLPGRYEMFGHDRICLGVVPFYSTDISDAWRLQEDLASEGYYLKLSRGCGQFNASFDFVRDGQWKETEVVTRDTAPLAISLAALRAFGVEVPV